MFMLLELLVKIPFCVLSEHVQHLFAIVQQISLNVKTREMPPSLQEIIRCFKSIDKVHSQLKLSQASMSSTV